MRADRRHDWRWYVGGLGRILIAIGVLVFGFVAYQLWGTGVEYARAQNELDDEFEALLAQAATTTTVSPTTTVPVTTVPVTTALPAPVPTTTAVASPVPPTTVAVTPAPPVVFEAGDVLARLEIPSIGLDTKVVEGVAAADLQRGPGHFPSTPRPGQLGNAAIAGHRSTYGEPFASLDGITVGDEIVVTTIDGRFVYRATGSEVVPPTAAEVIETADPAAATLTLTTCHPRWSASERLIVYAALDPATSAPPVAAPVETVPPSTPPTTGPPASTVPTATTGPVASTTFPPAVEQPATGEPASAFDQGWFSDEEAFAHVALWGLVLTAVSLGAYGLSRLTRRNWIGALVGIAPFVIVLYFFFQNVNRLLPAAL